MPKSASSPVRGADLPERDYQPGARGPLTERIQSAFFDIVNGRNPKYAEWLDRV